MERVILTYAQLKAESDASMHRIVANIWQAYENAFREAYDRVPFGRIVDRVILEQFEVTADHRVLITILCSGGTAKPEELRVEPTN
jgi:hypothetical protein